jgi:hypothetical protein
LSAGGGEQAEFLPTELEEFSGDPHRAWRAFELLQATADENGNWRFLPSQVLQEPEALTDDVMLLRTLYLKMKNQNPD